MTTADLAKADLDPQASLVDILSAVEPFYILPKDDVAEVVISPALKACASADVMIGYFASQSLAEIAPGLAAYLRSATEPLRLIVSPYLTAEDQDALRTGTLGSQELATQRLEAGLPDTDALARHSLECLAWLISAGRLQMKVALMRNALFHPKAWIFRDGRDEAVLHGSANMTGAGLGRNREQLSLARNWMGPDAVRTCIRLRDEFALLWGGGDSDCIVVEPQPAFDEADRKPEAPRNLLGVRTALDQRGEGLRFVGGVHREVVEVLGKARLGGSLAVGTEHEAGHLVIAGKDLVFGKGEHGPAATLAKHQEF